MQDFIFILFLQLYSPNGGKAVIFQGFIRILT